MKTPHASGLDGVVVAETALSDVDGEHGRLIIRGYAVEDLVEQATFEDVCCLMWDGAWPTAERREAMRASLAEARQHAFSLLPSLGTALDTGDAMEALRTAIGHVRSGDPARDRVCRPRRSRCSPQHGHACARIRPRFRRSVRCRTPPTVCVCCPGVTPSRREYGASTHISAVSSIMG